MPRTSRWSGRETPAVRPRRTRKIITAIPAALCGGLALALASGSRAAAQPADPINNALNELGSNNSILQMLILVTVLALVPAILICMTSFTRVIVILSFTRNALGTPTMPPSQVLIGTAFFISLFIMSPVITTVNDVAIKPYRAGEISQQEAFKRGAEPIREFMFKQTNKKELSMFVSLSKNKDPKGPEDVSTAALIPAFILSELKKAFIMAFLIYIPFLVIDVVVAGTLMSMGMLMLPPMIIALPFKLLLFVMVDGWYMVVRTLIVSFK